MHFVKNKMHCFFCSTQAHASGLPPGCRDDSGRLAVWGLLILSGVSLPGASLSAGAVLAGNLVRNHIRRLGSRQICRLLSAGDCEYGIG